MIETALYSRLTTYAPLEALISTRVYAVAPPQDVVLPYCVCSKVSNQRQYSHDGYSSLQRPRIQVSCFATGYLIAKQIAEQVIAALESWPGADNVQAAFMENEIDLYEQDTKLYHVPVDFLIWMN